MSSSEAMRTARRLIEVLHQRGMREVVLSPGSRSGPLALALAAADAQGIVRLHVRIDEREAGFLALGLAKVSDRPVAVVTTSGTAVTNLHPALLEAWHTGVPLVAVSADRPARLRGTGANQTTNQIDLLPPVKTISTLDDLDPIVCGPVHLNLELDQPLIEAGPWEFTVSEEPASRVSQPREVDELAAGLLTVVIAGDDSPAEYAEIAAAAGWPILAEPSSNLRSAPTAVATGRLLLGARNLAGRIERVVSLGHATLSRPVTALLSRTDIPIVHVGEANTFPAPAAPNVSFHRAVTAPASDGGWAQEWIAADEKLSQQLPHDEALSVAKIVGEVAGPDAILTLGPSQGLRDVDLTMPARQPLAKVVSNRGLAGIDGVLSTAIGATLAHGGQGFAYLGDLTFLHGSNGLVIGPHEPRPNLCIAVLNDDGGSIFASLEQGAPEYAENFERVYATPVGAKLGDLCRGLNIAHELLGVSELADYLKNPPSGLVVVEVHVPRNHRRSLSNSINAIAAQLF